MRKMFKKHCIAFVVAVLAGAGLHMLYKLWPNPVTAIFAPVNESVWEHMKLLFWPYLVAAIILTRNKEAKSAGYWAAHFASLLVMPLIVIAGYYLFSGALGIESMFIHIGLYVVAMAVGFFMSYQLYNSNGVRDNAALLGFFVVLLGACIVLFTFFPPDLPIFADPQQALNWMTIPY